MGCTNSLNIGVCPASRRTLELRYLEGFTQTEAATEMDTPLGTLKCWSGRAKHLLAQW